MRPCSGSLVWLVFGADHHPVAARSPDIVTHDCREIERRNPIRRAGLDNPARIVRAAKLIAEFRLGAVKRDKLIAAKCLDLVLRGRTSLHGPLSVVAFHGCNLLVASGMQVSQQACQFRFANKTQSPPPSLFRRPAFTNPPTRPAL